MRKTEPTRALPTTGPAAGVHAELAGARSGVGLARPRLVLAEDDDNSAAAVLDYFEARGFDMHLARDGAEAVLLVRALHPALVMMDIQMPMMDGLTAMRILREDASPAVRNVPIITLTARAMDRDQSRFLAAGATAAFSKPVRLKTLASAIEAILSSGREAVSCA